MNNKLFLIITRLNFCASVLQDTKLYMLLWICAEMHLNKVWIGNTWVGTWPLFWASLTCPSSLKGLVSFRGWEADFAGRQGPCSVNTSSTSVLMSEIPPPGGRKQLLPHWERKFKGKYPQGKTARGFKLILLTVILRAKRSRAEPEGRPPRRRRGEGRRGKVGLLRGFT